MAPAAELGRPPRGHTVLVVVTEDSEASVRAIKWAVEKVVKPAHGLLLLHALSCLPENVRNLGIPSTTVLAEYMQTKAEPAMRQYQALCKTLEVETRAKIKVCRSRGSAILEEARASGVVAIVMSRSRAGVLERLRRPLQSLFLPNVPATWGLGATIALVLKHRKPHVSVYIVRCGQLVHMDAGVPSVHQLMGARTFDTEDTVSKPKPKVFSQEARFRPNFTAIVAAQHSGLQRRVVPRDDCARASPSHAPPSQAWETRFGGCEVVPKPFTDEESDEESDDEDFITLYDCKKARPVWRRRGGGGDGHARFGRSNGSTEASLDHSGGWDTLSCLDYDSSEEDFGPRCELWEAQCPAPAGAGLAGLATTTSPERRHHRKSLDDNFFVELHVRPRVPWT
eukprot:SM000134S26937  [mRNA]  locus=s134:173011:174810:- [translate_table: standard]